MSFSKATTNKPSECRSEGLRLDVVFVVDADLHHGVSAGSVEWQTGQGLLVQHAAARAQK